MHQIIQAKVARQSEAGASNVRDLTSRLLFAVTFLLVFALYLLTLAPGVVGGDAGEHQLAVPLLGIPHTTGYPLYILAGKLWTLLIPFGNSAWRVNLFSAFGGALAAATTSMVIYRLAIEFPRPHQAGSQSSSTSVAAWSGAVVGGLALAWGLTLWQWSTIAGVRSFNIFFFALLTLQAVIFGQQRQTGATATAARTLAWLALTVGLSLAHHRTTVFYLPSLVGWVWWHDRRLIFRPRRLLLLIGLAVAPLLFYLFIYIRGINQPPYTHEQITDLASFWFLVGSGDSSGLFFSIDPAFLTARLSFIWRDVLAQLSWSGVILSIIGGAALLRRQPAVFLFQTLLVLFLLWFTLDFEVVNLNEAPTWYLMPAYFIFAMWLGHGLNAILDWRFPWRSPARTLWILDYSKTADNRPPPSTYSNLQLLITNYQLLITLVVLALLIITLAWPNWQRQHTAAIAPLDEWRQLLRGTQAQRFVESSLPQVKPNSIIWGDWEQYTPLKYAQLIEGRRPDLTVRNPLDRWPEKVAAARTTGQPIYFTRKPTDLIGTPYLSMAGPLIYLGSEPTFEVPSDLTPLQATFEDQLLLRGYRVEILPQPRADPILQLHLAWQLPQKTNWDYALSLRLLDTSGQERHKQDATHPVLSSYPTSLWTPGEVVLDFYELPFPTEHGPLTLHLLPYRSEAPGQWHNLVMNETGQEGVMLGPFEGR